MLIFYHQITAMRLMSDCDTLSECAKYRGLWMTMSQNVVSEMNQLVVLMLLSAPYSEDGESLDKDIRCISNLRDLIMSEQLQENECSRRLQLFKKIKEKYLKLN